MKIINLLFILAGFFAISACDDKPKSKIENPFSGQVKALEKAKDVELQLQEAAEKQRKSIDEMSK